MVLAPRGIRMLLELHAPAHLRVEDAVEIIASAVQGVWIAHPGLPPLDREALDRLRRVIGAWFGRTLDETRPGADGGEVWVLRESAEAPDLLGINAAREIALNWI